MPAAITMNVAKFKEQLQATTAQLQAATRPAAQAGVQVIYDRARQHAPVSDATHMFYGTNAVYGPYSPGNLRDYGCAESGWQAWPSRMLGSASDG